MGAICGWDPNAIMWLAHQDRPYTFGVIPCPIGCLAGFEISRHTLHCDVVMVAGNYHVNNEALKQFALSTIKEFHLPMTADPGGILCLIPKTFV